MAFQDGAKRAGLHLLEPVMTVEVVDPEPTWATSSAT